MQIHGSIVWLLKKFVVKNHGSEAWNKLTENINGNSKNISTDVNYSLTDFESILLNAEELTHLSRNALLEQFGEYMVPDLLAMYKSYINPEWKTFGMLENTEIVMHKAVRRLDAKANPPVLHISRVHDKLIVIDYYSERRMASLAAGIIKGIAKYYNESEKVHVALLTSQDVERVKIRVEFE